MKKSLTTSLILLVILTVTTVVIFNSSVNLALKNGLIIFLSYLKITLVAYYFMELKMAHLFWKASFAFLMGIIVVSVYIINYL